MVAATAGAAETVRFAVTDIEGLEALQTEYGPFRDKLAELTGYEIEFFPVSSRTAAVEALNGDQADLVLTGPAEYVVIKELTGAQIVVGWQRPDYFAQIVALADGPIKTAADLEGKKVSFGEVGSTSQHLGPAQALADLGLKYGENYEPLIIKRNTAVEAMINGDLAAVGMNFGHLRGVREAYPDVAFHVVARGPDLPNDILVASKDMAPEMVAKFRTTFVEHGKALMAEVLKGDDTKKYEGGFFLTEIEDADYDYVRSMYRAIGVDTFTEFVGE
jgi:phosphonate transport system substrate-binding protein